MTMKWFVGRLGATIYCRGPEKKALLDCLKRGINCSGDQHKPEGKAIIALISELEK